jgi:hypothetical protein
VAVVADDRADRTALGVGFVEGGDQALALTVQADRQLPHVLSWGDADAQRLDEMAGLELASGHRRQLGQGKRRGRSCPLGLAAKLPPRPPEAQAALEVDQPLHAGSAESTAFLQQMTGVQGDETDALGVERVTGVTEQLSVTFPGGRIPPPVVVAGNVAHPGEQAVRDGTEVGVVLVDRAIVHDVPDMADHRRIPGRNVVVDPPDPLRTLRHGDAYVRVTQKSEARGSRLGMRGG